MAREDFSKYNQKWEQQVLDFDFWEKEKKAEEERQQQEADGLPHFPKPRNDNERLLEYQWQYKHGDKEAIVQIYDLSVQICRKFINAIGQINQHVKELSWSDKKIKAEDAATYIIERYIKIPDFSIKKNFPGYLYLRVLHELYYRREVDKIQTYVDISQFFKENTDAAQPELWTHVLFEKEGEKSKEEDREQRELKLYYMWKQKQKK